MKKNVHFSISKRHEHLMKISTFKKAIKVLEKELRKDIAYNKKKKRKYKIKEKKQFFAKDFFANQPIIEN